MVCSLRSESSALVLRFLDHDDEFTEIVLYGSVVVVPIKMYTDEIVGLYNKLKQTPGDNYFNPRGSLRAYL